MNIGARTGCWAGGSGEFPPWYDENSYIWFDKWGSEGRQQSIVDTGISGSYDMKYDFTFKPTVVSGYWGGVVILGYYDGSMVSFRYSNPSRWNYRFTDKDVECPLVTGEYIHIITSNRGFNIDGVDYNFSSMPSNTIASDTIQIRATTQPRFKRIKIIKGSDVVIDLIPKDLGYKDTAQGRNLEVGALYDLISKTDFTPISSSDVMDPLYYGIDT